MSAWNHEVGTEKNAEKDVDQKVPEMTISWKKVPRTTRSPEFYAPAKKTKKEEQDPLLTRSWRGLGETGEMGWDICSSPKTQDYAVTDYR